MPLHKFSSLGWSFPGFATGHRKKSSQVEANQHLFENVKNLSKIIFTKGKRHRDERGALINLRNQAK